MVEEDIVALMPAQFQPQQSQVNPQVAPQSQVQPRPQPQQLQAQPTERELLTKMLASRAALDPELKLLMSVVSSGRATKEQNEMSGKHISDAKASMAAGNAATETPTSTTKPAEPNQSGAINSLGVLPLLQRAPLKPLPTNASVNSEPQQLKRKREPSHFSANPQVGTAIGDLAPFGCIHRLPSTKRLSDLEPRSRLRQSRTMTPKMKGNLKASSQRYRPKLLLFKHALPMRMKRYPRKPRRTRRTQLRVKLRRSWHSRNVVLSLTTPPSRILSNHRGALKMFDSSSQESWDFHPSPIPPSHDF